MHYSNKWIIFLSFYRKFLTGLLRLFVFAKLRNVTSAITGTATVSNTMTTRSLYMAFFSRI
jgi:hypothetical protein